MELSRRLSPATARLHAPSCGALARVAALASVALLLHGCGKGMPEEKHKIEGCWNFDTDRFEMELTDSEKDPSIMMPFSFRACSEQEHQADIFEFLPNGSIVNTATGKCLENGGLYAKLNLYRCHGEPSIWTLPKDDNGTVYNGSAKYFCRGNTTARNQYYSSRNLTVPIDDDSDDVNRSLRLADCQKGERQLWNLSEHADATRLFQVPQSLSRSPGPHAHEPLTGAFTLAAVAGFGGLAMAAFVGIRARRASAHHGGDEEQEECLNSGDGQQGTKE